MSTGRLTGPSWLSSYPEREIPGILELRSGEHPEGVGNPDSRSDHPGGVMESEFPIPTGVWMHRQLS